MPQTARIPSRQSSRKRVTRAGVKGSDNRTSQIRHWDARSLAPSQVQLRLTGTFRYYLGPELGNALKGNAPSAFEGRSPRRARGLHSE